MYKLSTSLHMIIFYQLNHESTFFIICDMSKYFWMDKIQFQYLEIFNAGVHYTHKTLCNDMSFNSYHFNLSVCVCVCKSKYSDTWTQI